MRKLRRKIVIGVFTSATVVFLLTIFAAWLVLGFQVMHRADSATELIEQYNGALPNASEYERLEPSRQIRLYTYDAETPYTMRYFSVYYIGDKIVANISHIASVDAETAISMAQHVKPMGGSTGYYHDYRYRISASGNEVYFLDCSDDFEAIRLLLLIITLIALLFIVMITVVFYFLSNRIVKPFEENSRTQKQFITDASHELKTPLAIISANAEVLAYKEGDNEWLQNITAQVSRVSSLVNELLTLNRLEEVDEATNIEAVNFSELIMRVCNEFEEVFKSKNTAVIYNVQPGVILNGNASQLERLISVLVENASKYADENGEVHVTLKRELRYTTLTIFNTCTVDMNADYKYLFDRFYRPDASRTSSTGGHGIGLSIAKRIVILHNGTIEAVPSEKGLTFNAKLSNRLRLGTKQTKS